ncbi:hypothetical protein BGI15_08595 [Snodgrassella alvi]|nr:hypothetical protein SASC598P14_011390 [Snodgrassella alvi SCGC AB-598-P14]OOX78670.1 hypothetical protein BGH94_07400 [Snodgrassella alvi]ORE99297.1 hypothetical protein BGH97_10490 [Snodgrassella alvi]ORF00505.1 hypothetical protein BGH95_08530 [Snodgrassella alvi]ORF03969.1 hypothetical protein BGH96_05585 [Snodgrassella alvi]
MQLENAKFARNNCYINEVKLDCENSFSNQPLKDTMMKKLLGIGAVLAALLLTACATTNSDTKAAPYSDVQAAVESN